MMGFDELERGDGESRTLPLSEIDLNGLAQSSHSEIQPWLAISVFILRWTRFNRKEMGKTFHNLKVIRPAVSR